MAWLQTRFVVGDVVSEVVGGVAGDVVRDVVGDAAGEVVGELVGTNKTAAKHSQAGDPYGGGVCSSIGDVGAPADVEARAAPATKM